MTAAASYSIPAVNSRGSIPVTLADLAALGIPADADTILPTLTTMGMWCILRTVRAHVLHGGRLYLPRTAQARSAGTDPCLRVSIGGRKRLAHLSSVMLNVEGKHLIDLAVLRVHGNADA